MVDEYYVLVVLVGYGGVYYVGCIGIDDGYIKLIGIVFVYVFFGMYFGVV